MKPSGTTLYHSPTSPYARKCRVVLREKNLLAQVKEAVAQPLDEPHFVRGINPLGRIPCLITEDGMLIADSPVICDYLDQLGGAPFLAPQSGKEKWRVWTMHALADGIMDAALTLRMEQLRPKEYHYPPNRDRQADAIDRTLAFLEASYAEWSPGFDLGDIALGAALGYLDLRFADWGWRERTPRLASWWQAMAERPSFQLTKP
ncbi:MAG TPA: glutathione S-transferase N-terminal domain-containing protein [Micropepsaceae bacterium]|nr:glutathione S-transferase N-terminal domain-containing protein [Micropepsaceae bacterium]